MGLLRKPSATLRFFGDDLIPSEITQVLGCRPTSSAIKEEFIAGETAVDGIAGTGMWLSKSGPIEPGDLDIQIARIISSMTDDVSVWRKLASQYEADLFCGLWLDGFNSGQPLNADTLWLIAERNLKLDLDIYGDPEQESA